MQEEQLKTPVGMPIMSINDASQLNDERFIRQLENIILPVYLKRCRWFGGKAMPMLAVKVYQFIPVHYDNYLAVLLLIKVRYEQHATEIYSLPLGITSRDADIPAEGVIAANENVLLIDAIYQEQFRIWLFRLMKNRARLQGAHYPMEGNIGGIFNPELLISDSRVLKAEQSNSSIIYGEKYFFKLFRKIEYTINPDQEIIQFLTEKTGFKNIPAFAGAIQVTHPEKGNALVGMMQALVPNDGNAWSWYLNKVRKYYGIIETYQDQPPDKMLSLSMNFADISEPYKAGIDHELYSVSVRLGAITARMHQALASGNDEAFAPENFDAVQADAFKEHLHQLVDHKFRLLSVNFDKVPEFLKADTKEIIEQGDKVKAFFDRKLSNVVSCKSIRIHGDYHLGQVLMGKDDLVVLDFEGEPDKLHHERRMKHPPVKDVAGMMRSFRYAAYAMLFELYGNQPELLEKLIPFADYWYHCVSRFYLGSYLQTMKGSELLPEGEAIIPLLQAYSFEKAVYELGYEINNRPDWAVIPLQSIVKFIKYYLHE